MPNTRNNHFDSSLFSKYLRILKAKHGKVSRQPTIHKYMSANITFRSLVFEIFEKLQLFLQKISVFHTKYTIDIKLNLPLTVLRLKGKTAC